MISASLGPYLAMPYPGFTGRLRLVEKAHRPFRIQYIRNVR